MRNLSGRALAVALVLVISALPSPAAPRKTPGAGTAEQRTARYFQQIRSQPSLLLAFLREMPKGGDLHNHLAGAIYAESLINYAVEDGLCVERSTMALRQPPCTDSAPVARQALQDPVLYQQMVDAYSMRSWDAARDSGHDHFFYSFDKFLPATERHEADMVAEAQARAAADHLSYLELMQTLDNEGASSLGAKIGWEDDWARLREKLLQGGLHNVVAATRKTLDQDEAKAREKLHCNTPQADPGCGVMVRYLYQVLRGLPREQVFAQILLGFELARADPRVVGLNLVMPEDWYVPMHDFELHMRMLDYLHQVYANVHISLHAGELALGLVPPEGLRFHIRESVERGHAQRIGHGVDIMHENDPFGLLREMAQRGVLVEICLTSNDLILGVRGQQHPLPIYLRYGVPVALATDDEGVARGNMTQEYVRAAETYGLSYLELKAMARQSLEHSFLPGASLWQEARNFRPVAACAGGELGAKSPPPACRRFLADNEHARVQWQEEGEFARFEKKF